MLPPLPPLPKLPPLPPLPPLPLPLPTPQYDPDVDEGYFSHVSKIDRDKALLRIGSVRAYLTRSECYTLIGQLERVARRL